MLEFGIFILNRCGALRAWLPALLASLAVLLAWQQQAGATMVLLGLALYLLAALQQRWQRHLRPLQHTLTLLGESLASPPQGEALLVRCREQQRMAERLRSEGGSVMHLAVDGQLAGILAVTDPIKSTTPDAIRTLHASGLRIVMATGDGLTTAKAVGAVADAVVIGSRLVQILQEAPRETVAAAGQAFMAEIRAALDRN